MSHDNCSVNEILNNPIENLKCLEKMWKNQHLLNKTLTSFEIIIYWSSLVLSFWEYFAKWDGRLTVDVLTLAKWMHHMTFKNNSNAFAPNNWENIDDIFLNFLPYCSMKLYIFVSNYQKNHENSTVQLGFFFPSFIFEMYFLGKFRLKFSGSSSLWTKELFEMDSCLIFVLLLSMVQRDLSSECHF